MGLFKKKMHYSFDVVGLPYYQEAQNKVGNIDRNTRVEVIPEPENKHDKNALMVIVNGQKVGYVAARQCNLVKGILNLGTIYDILIEVSKKDTEWIFARVTMLYKK